MIDPEITEKIQRLFHVEHWPIGTIAKELGLHHSVVRRVLKISKTTTANRIRPSKLDPYLPFIQETLEKYPRLKASRLKRMLFERGLVVSGSHLREVVSKLRPRRAAEAYLRLKTLPGEQMQVDWAHFGELEVDGAMRPLVAFVMVLSYSRALFLRYFLGLQQANFLKGHVEAFRFFHGLGRTALYDNLKSAVLERKGDAIRFNPTLLEFAAHYRFEARPVAVRRGNEKGRVERMIRTIREGFFAARPFKDLDDLNRQALLYCEGEALDRPFVEDKKERVRDAFLREQPLLLPLPDDDFPTLERVLVKVGKTPYVRFDQNDYSVPHECVLSTLVVFADEKKVRVFDGEKVVAEHERSFGKGRRIEDQKHLDALVERKRAAHAHRGVDRLVTAVPIAMDLLKKIAERGLPLLRATKRLEALLDTFGATELERAIAEVLKSGVFHESAVAHVLDKNRDQNEPPPLPLPLDHRPDLKLTLRPPSLDDYATLNVDPDTFIPEAEDVHETDEDEHEQHTDDLLF